MFVVEIDQRPVVIDAREMYVDELKFSMKM